MKCPITSSYAQERDIDICIDRATVELQASSATKTKVVKTTVASQGYQTAKVNIPFVTRLSDIMRPGRFSGEKGFRLRLLTQYIGAPTENATNINPGISRSTALLM